MGRMKEQEIHRQETTRPQTRLGDLHREGVDIFCWCNRCGHNASIDVPLLIGRFGPALPVPEVGARLRCSGCGSKDVATRPDWPSLGEVARHA